MYPPQKKSNPAWKASQGCTDVTTWGSRVLCEKIGELDTKLKAAEARDEAQRQIDEIDNAPAKATAVPLPTADNGAIIRMIGWIGFKATTSTDVDQNYEIALVLAYELLAAVMPAIAFRTIVSSSVAATAKAEIGAEIKAETEGEISGGNDTPTPPQKRKQGGNRERKSAQVKAGNNEGAQILPFPKRRPTAEEVSAMKASGKTWKEIAPLFGYTDRQFRNIRKEIFGSQAKQAA